MLSEHAALELIANWCEQKIDSLPRETVKIADECGYLPLALSMCGAMAKNGRLWLSILKALQNVKLELIEACLPNYPNINATETTNVMRVLKVSVGFLLSENSNAVRRYHELAIFPADESVPEATIVTLWAHTGN